MIALVTGATGFVGSHLVERLVERGDEVRCLVRATSDRRWLAAVEGRVRLVEGDLDALVGTAGASAAAGAPGDGGGVGAGAAGAASAASAAGSDAARLLVDGLRGVEVVFHVGGLTRRTRKEPERFFRVNALGTAALAAACARAAPSLQRLVYASTLAAVGPSTSGRPLEEDTLPRPLTAYGASKRAGEVALMARAAEVPSTILRLPGIYGPRDENMIQLFRSVRRGLYPAGRRWVSLLHVSDTVDALLAAAGARDVPSARIFHLGAEATTVSGLGRAASAALEVHALPLPISTATLRAAAWIAEGLAALTGRPGFLDREKARELCGSWPVDWSRARRELGWQPRIPLAAGLRDLAAWYRKEGWLA